MLALVLFVSAISAVFIKTMYNVKEVINEDAQRNSMNYHTASIISRMCCIGDSLTVGWGLSDNSGTDESISRTNYNICWGKQYERLTGTNVQIIGASGMTANDYWLDQFALSGNKTGDFADKLETMEEDEVYIIGLGRNYD